MKSVTVICLLVGQLFFAQLSGENAAGPQESEPVAESTAAVPTKSIFVQIFENPLNLLLISGLLFVLLVLRPQQKQMKEHQAAVAGLKKNDRVVTSSGIHGTIVQANQDEPVVTIRIDENSGAKLTMNRDAIAKVIGEDAG